jgi:putative hydrolase of the HAD superfamily
MTVPLTDNQPAQQQNVPEGNGPVPYTVTALVFDLDGTLYVNDALGREINLVARRYLAALKNVTPTEAEALLGAARSHLVAAGQAGTLSQAVAKLGGDLRDLHSRFAAEIRPEDFLNRDDRVVDLLKGLGHKFALYIYTNNNVRLATAITDLLGVTSLFRRIFTIEDSWRPKPDRSTLEQIFRTIDVPAAECLFIGDRYEVDLRLPAQMGSPVFAVNNIEELLSLPKFFTKENQ